MIHKGTQILETQRLILRPFRPDDAETIFKNWASDGEAAKFWSWNPHENIEETRSILAGWTGEYARPDYYHWAIEYRETGENVGYIYLDSIDGAEKCAAVHFLISRALWNKGLMTEACNSVLDFAMNAVGFARLESWRHEDNPASGRVMEKCGMKHIKTEYRTSETPRLSGNYLYYEKRAQN